MTISIAKTNDTRSIFSHWAWVVPVLLFVSSMTIYQIDLVPPSNDEWVTMSTTALADWENPVSFLQLHTQGHLSHMPGFYILLTAWSKLTSPDIAMLRFLGVLLTLLTVAHVYRLASVFIAPVAGLFAAIIVASNAFFNFYIAHARPYSLLVLLSCLTIWLYLRMVHRRVAPSNRGLIFLGTTVFAIVMTHLFSATLLFTLGLYHLLFVPKDRRWLKVGLAIVIPIIICLPMIWLVLYGNGYSTAFAFLPDDTANTLEAVHLWLIVMLNNQPVALLILIVAGILLGIRQRLIIYRPWLTLPVLFGVTIAFLGQFTRLITPSTYRHQLDGWILLVLCAAASLYAIYKWKRWLWLLILLWLLSGSTFQQTAVWRDFTGFRADTFWHPPIQVVSRLAQEQPREPYILHYPFTQLHYETLIPPFIAGYTHKESQRYYYFSQHGIDTGLPQDEEELVEQLQYQALQTPTIWHLYQKPLAAAEDLSIAAEALRELQYEFCEEQQVGLHTIINHYSWDLLDCQPPANPTRYHTDFIDYNFFKAGFNSDANAVMFIGQWASRLDFDTNSYKASYQLLSKDWNNVAQLDLPLVAEGELRQYAIDVSQAPAGTYRLMLIIYNTTSGDRLAWNGNPGYVPEMLELDEITIAAS